MNKNLLTIIVTVTTLVLSACAPAAATAVSPKTQPAAAAQPQQIVAEAPKAPASQPTYSEPRPAATAAPAAPFQPAAPNAANSPYPTGSPYQDNYFQGSGINPFEDAREDHLSTFGLDVDTASYTVMRGFINDGSLPPADSVRVEEFVNFFKMHYKVPPEVAFAVYADGAPSPYTYDGTQIVRIGVQGYTVSEADRKSSNLVFVIDVSGSMEQGNRLELVKDSLAMLVERLRPEDTVAIVVFGTSARVILPPTNSLNRDTLLEAIYSLRPEGTTNVEAGLILGYEMALKGFQPQGNNRVILCSDGVANTGAVLADTILERIHGYTSEGVTLTTAGFGMGNYNDALMERMADKGNGSYSYVDSKEQAQRLFVDQLTSTLQVIARDAKVQVDFNPDVVTSYRLMGYENRAIADQDFRNDSVDAGEIGAGHSVTALYAVRLVPGAQGRIATVQLRWKDADSYEVREINGNINTFDLSARFDQAGPRYQLAVAAAQFAEILRNSPYAGHSFGSLREQADRLAELLPGDRDVAEFVGLVNRAYQNFPSLAQ